MSDAGMQGANGGERRRRTWSADQKQRIIAESFAAGASVAEVARRYGLNSNMLFTWRRRERVVNDVAKTVNIVPVRVVEATPTATATASASMGRMEIVLVGGERIIVGADVDATALAMIVQETLKRDPHSGHLLVFRGRRGSLVKCLWSDGQGLCLFSKRLEGGRFLWPSLADGTVTISTAQLSYLLSGIDWRMPQETWRPTAVG